MDFVSYIAPGASCATLDAEQLDVLILQIDPSINPDPVSRYVRRWANRWANRNNST